jgi:hypothetical protein
MDIWIVAQCRIRGVTHKIGIAQEREDGPWLFSAYLARSDNGPWKKTGAVNYVDQSHLLKVLDEFHPWDDFEWIDERAKKMALSTLEQW